MFRHILIGDNELVFLIRKRRFAGILGPGEYWMFTPFRAIDTKRHNTRDLMLLMPAKSDSPAPGRIGEMARCISSTSPARMYCRMVSTPPPSRTSLPLPLSSRAPGQRAATKSRRIPAQTANLSEFLLG